MYKDKKKKNKTKILEARSLRVSAFLPRNTEHLQKWAAGQSVGDSEETWH